MAEAQKRNTKEVFPVRNNTTPYFNTKKHYPWVFYCRNCKAFIPEEDLVEETRYYHKKGVPGLTEYIGSTSWTCKKCGQDYSLEWGIPIDVDVSFREANGENESLVDYPNIGSDVTQATFDNAVRGISNDK